MNTLSGEQAAALRARLEQAMADLQRLLAAGPDRGAHAPAHEMEASPADNASQRTLNQLQQEAAEHTARRLRSVRHALARFDDGSYGLCEFCGEAIGASRLAAAPEARYCIACQSRLENPPRA